MSEEILEKFESDSITFTVYGLQVEGKANTSKVTQTSNSVGHANTTFITFIANKMFFSSLQENSRRSKEFQRSKKILQPVHSGVLKIRPSGFTVMSRTCL